MTDLSRRQLLAGAGATAGMAVTGGLGYAGLQAYMESRDNEEPLDVDIYQSEEMAAFADMYDTRKTYAQEVLASYTEEAFDDLFERAGVEADIDITVVDDPVSVKDHELIDDLASEWYEDVQELDNPAAHGNLLVHSEMYMDALGQGQSGIESSIKEFETCGTSGEGSASSVLGKGYRLFELDPKEPLDEIPWRVHDENGNAGPPPPGRVAVSGVHELGHNMCLDHDHGDLTIQDDEEGRDVYTTVMMTSYYNSDEAVDVPEVRSNDDIYLRNRFSARAVTAMDERYDTR